ncbi:MAG: [Fe-Fe] hydrogenase large subunit C-terminal domain-containing protein [Calditrichia bacterium]
MSVKEIIFTNEARCQDCYRCVRVCPVKAVGWKDGQAYVEKDRCIHCGTCIKECPQQAKAYRNDLYKAKRLLREGLTAISVAPSFAGLFPEWMAKRLPSALRRLGFSVIAETAVGVSHHVHHLIPEIQSSSGRFVLDSSCPAFIEFAEKYEPSLLNKISQIPSPMVLHAIHLRQTYSHIQHVVFAGPCIAKKKESERPEFSDLINCVLTFEELMQWFEEDQIDLKSCEESDFDDKAESTSRYFPVPTGLERVLTEEADGAHIPVEAVHGATNVKDFCQYMKSAPEESGLGEVLWCSHGCIGGPATGTKLNPFTGKHTVKAYSESQKNSSEQHNLINNFPKLQFRTSDDTCQSEYTEKEINSILIQMGKNEAKDELNCGACGYNSCRDKAVAILEGMAQTEMCIPYMRSLAEQRSDKIIETSPNGIVILDENLNILKINPSFKRIFRCSNAILGKHISYLMDSEPFEHVLYGKLSQIEEKMEIRHYNLVLHYIIYKIPEEKQIVAIFVNVTNQIRNKEMLETIKRKSLLQAQELLNHQIQMAQEMAKFLGEQTAKGETLVENLMKLVDDKSDNQ